MPPSYGISLIKTMELGVENLYRRIYVRKPKYDCDIFEGMKIISITDSIYLVAQIWEEFETTTLQKP